MVSNAAMQDRRSTANIKPPTRGQAASQARYAQMGLAMKPSKPLPPTPPAPPADSGSGAGDGTPVYYGAATPSMPAVAQPDVSVETLTKTPEYMARERAIAAAMELFGSKQNLDKARYEENYGKSLSELGYDPTSSQFDRGELLTSGQRATASGKAYNALRNDFAARGMLQSGAFQAQQGVLLDQLMKQREAIDTGRSRFLEDQQAAVQAQQLQNEQQRRAALDEARQSILSRFAMGG